MQTWAIALRRSVLLPTAVVFVALAVASDRNAWNLRAFHSVWGHPVTLATMAALALSVELVLSFRSFLVWTVAGGALVCAVGLLVAAGFLAQFHTSAHDGPTVAQSPDGRIRVVRWEAETAFGPQRRLYVLTSAGFDREGMLATGCIPTAAGAVRFDGNRAVEIRGADGAVRRVTFDKNLNVARAAVFGCPAAEHSG